MTQDIALPDRLKGRPTYKGMIVPYFVAWFLNGQQCNEAREGAQPSFPVTDYARLITSRKQNRCWICGHMLGTYKAFVFGPGSALARASYEPPSHRDCARYAVQVCPYLTNPDHQHMTEKGYTPKPGEQVLPDVEPHNPGMAVIWVCRKYGVEVRDASRGIFNFVPEQFEWVEFWTCGRRATYKEVADAIQRSIHVNNMLDAGNNRELAWRVQDLLRHVEDAHGGVT